jgi:hypothetical protein
MFAYCVRQVWRRAAMFCRCDGGAKVLCWFALGELLLRILLYVSEAVLLISRACGFYVVVRIGRIVCT